MGVSRSITIRHPRALDERSGTRRPAASDDLPAQPPEV